MGNRRLELAGSLEAMGMADLVQVMEVARKSGVVRIRSAAGRATLWVRDGAIVDAAYGTRVGIDAAREILVWSTGRFDVEFGPVDRADAIGRSASSLLLDAMVARDEAERDRPTSPPIASRRRPARTVGALAVVALATGLLFHVRATQAGKQRAQADVAASPDGLAPPTPQAAEPEAAPAATTAEPDAPRYRLAVFTSPPGVDVWIAGRYRATTPAVVPLGRLTGRVAVELVRDGRVVYVTSVGPGPGWLPLDGEWVRAVRATFQSSAPTSTHPATFVTP